MPDEELDDKIAVVHQRYRQPVTVGPWNRTIDSMVKHRPVRPFLPDAVDKHTLGSLIAAAFSAPTSSNLQTWSVIDVTDPEERAKIAQISGDQKHVVHGPLLLVLVADLSRAPRVGEDRGAEIAGIDRLDSFLVARIDTTLAAQHCVIAAESLGLGTVYSGALRNDVGAVSRMLNLPAQSFAVLGLVIGHPDPAQPRAVKPTLPPCCVLHHYSYRPEAREFIDQNDADTISFRDEHSQSPEGWRTLLLQRLGTLRAFRSGIPDVRAVPALVFH